MAPRTVYANLQDGLQPFSLWDASLADMGTLGVIPCTASGTNAITLTPVTASFPPNVTNPPRQNQLFSFVAAATSTGSVTVSISGVAGFLKLYLMDASTQAGSGDVKQNVTYIISYGPALNGAAGGFQIQSPNSDILNPVITGAMISASTITTSSYNGNTWTTGTGTLTIGASKTLTANNTVTLSGTDGKSLTLTNALIVSGNDGTISFGAASKTLTINNSLALSGADGTVMTFPSTSATIARTDAGQTFTGTNAFGALTATTVNGNTITAGTFTLTGTAAKTLTFQNSLTLAGSDGTTLTFQGTDTYVGRATTDTLTNKTFNSAGTGNTLQISGVTVSRGQIPGTSTNDNATSGNFGEYVSSTVARGSPVSLTTATPANVTSITISAGDWDVTANGLFTGTATGATLIHYSIGTTSATENISAGNFSGFAGTINVGASDIGVGSISNRFSVAGSTQIFLVGRADFASGAVSGYGLLQARRVR